MGNDLKVKEEYTNPHKHIQINFNVYINQTNPVMNYKIMDIDTKEVLTEKLEIINIDVTFFANTWYNKEDAFSKLMGLIGTKDKEDMKYFKKEKGIMKEIMDKADKFRDYKEIVQVYDYDAMRDNREVAAKNLGKDEGIKEGIKQGKLQNTNNIAKNLIKENIDVEIIAKVTGLSKEEIDRLQNN